MKLRKNEAIGWINTINRQPFPVVTFSVLKELHKIAEMEDQYPVHDYLVAANHCDSEIMKQISNRI